MMRNKLSGISVFLGTFLLVNVPFVFGDHDMIGNVTDVRSAVLAIDPSRVDIFAYLSGKIICDLGQIIRGTNISVQSVCGNNIYVPGISNETFFSQEWFPVSFRGHLEMEDGTKLPFVEGQISHDILSGYDITDLLPSDTISIPEGTCDNREVKVFLALESVATQKSTEISLKRRVLCSFQGVDLELAVTGTSTVPTISLSDSVNTLMSAMSEGFNFQFTASNIGGSSLPQLTAPTGDPDILIPGPSYFVSVYIKRDVGNMAYTPDECRAASGTTLPNVTKDDIVVDTFPFTDSTELAEIDVIAQVKANEDQLQLCGDHVLVFMLDPFHTLWNEDDRCNNFQTIRIQSTQTCKPSCDIIVNPWTAAGVQARYRGSGTDGQVHRTFEMTVDGVRESYEHDYVSNVGYGRLALLTHFIKKHYAADSSACANYPGASEQLNFLEGEDASTEETKVLPNAYMSAKTVLTQLEESVLTPEQAKEQLNSTLQNILSQIHETTESKVNSNISKFALEKALNQVSNMESLTYDDSCEIGWIMEGEKWLHNTVKHEIDPSTVTKLAGHLAAAAIVNPQWTCLENLLKKLIKYAETIDNANDDTVIPAAFFFDEDALKQETPEALGRCGMTNKCLQKFHKNCLMKNKENWEPIQNSQDRICEQYILKRSAISLYKSLGLYDLWKEMQQNDEMEGKFCVQDPLKPRFGPVTLWKSQEDSTGRTYVYSGIPNFDNTQISWTKRAICSCQSCESGGDDWTTSSDEPELRRRRKK